MFSFEKYIKYISLMPWTRVGSFIDSFLTISYIGTTIFRSTMDREYQRPQEQKIPAGTLFSCHQEIFKKFFYLGIFLYLQASYSLDLPVLPE